MGNEVSDQAGKEVDVAERQIVPLHRRLYEKNGVGQDLALKFLKRGILLEVPDRDEEKRFKKAAFW